MPARNIIKQYIEGGFYHLYNRGVEKRSIFQSTQDQNVFIKYLSEYLTPKDETGLRLRLTDPTISSKERYSILKLLRLNNFTDEIKLLAYCLMPNHFHFFVQQKSINTIDSFMQSLGTRYTMFFNLKYKRVGSLFQAVYKAVLIETEEQFLHLSRYIHKQALASKGETLQSCPSSYEDYIEKRKTAWVHPENILNYFSNTIPSLSYEAFVNQPEDTTILQNVMIDVD